jgi:hypothetical protein
VDFGSIRIPVRANRHREDVQTALSNPEPELLVIQHDSYWSELRMKEDQPYVVLPLVSDGKLCGQITADNHPSGRAIEPGTVESLALLGRLAAPLFAREEGSSENQETSE